MRYLLNENMVSTIALYIILKKMMTPFSEWDAYKLGIIDADGKKLKEPKTSKELATWDLLTKFCWNFKKILAKFVGKSKLAHYLSAAYLLKDNINLHYIEFNKIKLNEDILSDFNCTKQSTIYQMLQTLPPLEVGKVTEDNFEFLMYLYTKKFEKLIEELDFSEKVL